MRRRILTICFCCCVWCNELFCKLCSNLTIHYLYFCAFISSQISGLSLPLPPKKLIGNMDREFIAERQKGLQNYLNFITSNHILSNCEIVKKFLDPNNYSANYTGRSHDWCFMSPTVIQILAWFRWCSHMVVWLCMIVSLILQVCIGCKNVIWRVHTSAGR